MALDRLTESSSSKGALVNTYITHNWEREVFKMAGAEVLEGVYFRYDNSSQPEGKEFKVLKTNKELGNQLCKQAYLYLYLAEQLLNSNMANCFDKKAAVTTNQNSFERFYELYLRDYIRAHSMKIKDDPNLDKVYFSVTVDTDGSAKLIPSSIHHMVEESDLKVKLKDRIDSFKQGLRPIIEQNLNKLAFSPAEKQCKRYKSKIRLNFFITERANFAEENMTYTDE